MRNMNSTPKNMYLLYGSTRMSIRLHMYTLTPSHTHRLTWTLQYLPVQSPRCLPTMIPILRLVMRDGRWLPYYQRTTTSTNVAWASKGSWYFGGGLRLISGAEYWTEYAFETPLRFLGLWIFNVSLTLAKETSGPLWPDVGLERSFTMSLGSLLGDGALGCAKIPPPFFLTLLWFGDTLLGDALLLCWEWESTVSYHLQATEIKNKMVSINVLDITYTSE